MCAGGDRKWGGDGVTWASADASGWPAHGHEAPHDRRVVALDVSSDDECALREAYSVETIGEERVALHQRREAFDLLAD